MMSTLAIIALVVLIAALVIADKSRERRLEDADWADYLDAIREDAINEADYDAMSDTPIHDDIALARLCAGLADWGRDL